MINNLIYGFVCLCFATTCFAQDFEVENYNFKIQLNDKTDLINGEAVLKINFLKPQKIILLDLVNQKEGEKKGMNVHSVSIGKHHFIFKQSADKLRINLTEMQDIGTQVELTIHYHGVPADGLVIDINKFGDRTFFGDNWPNRAHHWLPCIDHPSDKATVSFTVVAPHHYSVIANGVKTEETYIDSFQKMTTWVESTPIPTKVMVIGAARFAIEELGAVNEVPMSSWVYYQNKTDGFNDYRVAMDIFSFFEEKLGNYSYEKLANVQSKTRYGGMENAGNIFYFENSVNGKADQEKLIAHEIAHQWFGNSATEADWRHIWLSEGFATYMTDVYLEEVRGKEAMAANLIEERAKVIRYAQNSKNPIIYDETSDLNKLLNPNSYQKGAWFLHMLRKKVGDDNFWSAVLEYYNTYQNSIATTDDFKRIVEATSKQDLDAFFNQWLYQVNHPKIKVNSSTKRGKTSITVQQKQEENFDFDLNLLLTLENGTTIEKTIPMDKKEVKVKFDMEITKIQLDPKTELLFEELK
ncbi:MAG: aminopeptidase N [Lentimonas sp.]|jgi:aminopeptidase N